MLKTTLKFVGVRGVSRSMIAGAAAEMQIRSRQVTAKKKKGTPAPVRACSTRANLTGRSFAYRFVACRSNYFLSFQEVANENDAPPDKRCWCCFRPQCGVVSSNHKYRDV